MYNDLRAIPDDDDCANTAQQGCAPPGPNQPSHAPEPESAFDRWTGVKGTYRPAAATITKLPPGIYSAEQDNRGLYLEAKRFPSDALLNLPGLPTGLIMDEVKNFWKREPLFRKFGFLHKRGIMMCGPAGCGKTSIIRMVCNDIIERDGIILLVQNFAITVLALAAIRDIEPDRVLMTVTEDLDEFVKPEKNTKPVLSMFDGENQVDHVIHLATTNHPERLEANIIQRPSRFDMILVLGTPNQEAREAYLRHILCDNLPEDEFQTLVGDTKGLSLAHLKDYIVSTVCLGKSPKETIVRLQDNMKHKPTLKGESLLGFRGEGFKIHLFGDEEKSGGV